MHISKFFMHKNLKVYICTIVAESRHIFLIILSLNWKLERNEDYPMMIMYHAIILMLHENRLVHPIDGWYTSINIKNYVNLWEAPNIYKCCIMQQNVCTDIKMTKPTLIKHSTILLKQSAWPIEHYRFIKYGMPLFGKIHFLILRCIYHITIYTMQE